MGCGSSTPAKPPTGNGPSRSTSAYGSRRMQQLGRDSLPLASAALAGLPLPATCSSNTSTSSEVDYSSGCDDSTSTSSLSTEPAIVAGTTVHIGAGGGLPPGQMHRPLACVKTTYKLRVGVLEGTTFLNQYIVVDTLGRGSFGKVKLCLNTGDDTLYAVKVVNTRALRAGAKSRLQSRSLPAQSRRRRNPDASAEAAASTDSLACATPGSPTSDLRREVEVMRSLNHPNLCTLYEVIEDDEGGKVLLVVEYCEAGALVVPGALTPDCNLPEAMAQYYFRQMAAGLAYLHANHVVHGDVKPENVMLSGSGTVKIGDFGQSQFFDRRDTFNRTLGTPAYLAPEVCAGETYRGRQADVWALGVSLYLFIFGEMPFKGDSVLELYDAVAAQEVPYPRSKPISHELQDLFLRLLHKDPRHRITAAEVMQHPWVSGSAWHVLLPDLSRSPAASDTDGERAGSIGQPSPASFNAEEVAAVVFPEMHAELGPAGGSPRSPGGSRTQLVDALAAATMAAGDDDMACRLARSPRSRLHNLAEDSMIERSWDQQGSSGGPSSVAEADRGPASADGDAQPPVAPISQVAPIPQAAMAAAEAQLDSSASAGNGSQGAGEVRGDIMMDMERVEFNLLEQQQEQETLASWQWTEQQEQPMLGQKQSADEPLPPIPFGVTNLASSSFMQEAQRGTLGDGQLPGSQEKQQQDDTSSANFGSDIKSRESPIRGLARASPAGGAASSTARRVRAKRLDTLRSFFAGPADFVVGALPQEHQHYSHKPPPLPGAPAPRRSLASGLFAGPADVVKGAEEVLPAGARVPPRAPPPRPTSQQPVVVNIFKPGERMGVVSHLSTCFYIEQGVVELRYEADVPVTLSSILSAALPAALFRRPSSASPTAAAAAAASSSGSHGYAHHRQPSASSSSRTPTKSGSCQIQLGCEDTADCSAHGSRVFNLGTADTDSQAGRSAVVEMERSSSLAAVVQQATLRAEALLSNAKAGSVDHLLVSERSANEFLGGLAMLDPRIFMGRWKATAVAKTHVVLLHMTREGLELFLQQNPLAQVHLRASMARARAEVVVLEALEKIAVAHQHQHQLLQKQRARRRKHGTAAGRKQDGIVAPRPRAAPLLLGTLERLSAGKPGAADPVSAAPMEAAAGPDAPLSAVSTAATANVAAAAAASVAAAETQVEEPVSSFHENATPSSHGQEDDDRSSEEEESEEEEEGAMLASSGIPSATLELFSMVSRLRNAILERAAVDAAPGGALSALASMSSIGKEGSGAAVGSR